MTTTTESQPRSSRLLGDPAGLALGAVGIGREADRAFAPAEARRPRPSRGRARPRSRACPRSPRRSAADPRRADGRGRPRARRRRRPRAAGCPSRARRTGRRSPRRRRRRAGRREASSVRHRPLDGLELLGREGGRRPSAVELFHVDPSVVASLDRAHDDARSARVQEREGCRRLARLCPRTRRSGGSTSSRRSRRSGGRRARARRRPRPPRGAGRRSGPASETAKSTRSALPPPSSTSCAERTRRTLSHATRQRDASDRIATRAAPAAIHPAVVLERSTAPPRLAREREDDGVLVAVVRGVRLAGDGLHRHLHRRRRPERRLAEVLERRPSSSRPR